MLDRSISYLKFIVKYCEDMQVFMNYTKTHTKSIILIRDISIQ